MNLRNLISVFICALFMVSGVAVAQQRTSPSTTIGPAQGGPTSLAAPGGGQRFPACCESCPAGGCTGCNSGPEGLNCGTGLIKAKCQTVNDVTTCVKDE